MPTWRDTSIGVGAVNISEQPVAVESKAIEDNKYHDEKAEQKSAERRGESIDDMYEGLGHHGKCDCDDAVVQRCQCDGGKAEENGSGDEEDDGDGWAGNFGEDVKGEEEEESEESELS